MLRQGRLDLGVIELRAPEQVRERRNADRTAVIPAFGGVGERSRAERQALVAARRHDEEALDLRPLAQHHVQLHVHEHSARDGHVVNSRLAHPREDELPDDVFDEPLYPRGDAVEPEAFQPAVQRVTECGTPQLRDVAERQAAGARLEERPEDLVRSFGEPRRRVRREAHDLELVLEGLHAEELGHADVHLAD